LLVKVDAVLALTAVAAAAVLVKINSAIADGPGRLT